MPHNNDWAVKGEGNIKATVVVKTQKEAINMAREIPQNQKSELFIHNQEGKIRGRDPKKIKGQLKHCPIAASLNF